MSKWLTFDLDGTLMQNPFVGWVFPEIAATINDELTEEINVTQVIVEKHNERMRNGHVFEAYDWDDIVAEVIRELELAIQIDVEEIVVKHCVGRKVFLLENHIVDSLKKLRGLGYSLAVVTNGYYKYQYPVLKELGIADLFDRIITPENCMCAKPSIDMLRTLHDVGEIVAHIGDRIDHDVVMANELGIQSIFINRHLSMAMKELPVNQRIKNEDVLKLCEEKWKQEKGEDARTFKSMCIPDVVLASVGEVVDYIKKKEKVFTL